MNMQVKTGGGVLALPPIIVDQLPDNRLTYKQLREDRSIKVWLTDIKDESDVGGVKVELHLFPKGVIPVERDPTYVVGTKLKADQPGGNWTFPIEFDVPVTTMTERFDANGEYTSYEMMFFIYDFHGNSDTSDTYAEVLVDLTAP
ncbi:hypothetical protein [Pseudomonas sp.]|uniref:hypothetical protein n=1 Tax=Pseudomonas sp. TaxID=306 RepID=UPI00286ACBAF|nr:hypothetical protein [Pseudomonas sp.]